MNKRANAHTSIITRPSGHSKQMAIIWVFDVAAMGSAGILDERNRHVFFLSLQSLKAEDIQQQEDGQVYHAQTLGLVA